MDKKLLTREEYDEWFKKIPPGHCTFCRWKEYQIVLKEFVNWIWIANIAPYWEYHTMIVPKRHFTRYTDMTFKEAGELLQVIDYTEKKIVDAKLYTDTNKLIEKVVYFWRYRHNAFDSISGTIRPTHFHLHLSPDVDHRWDPTVNKNACNIDMSVLK